MIPRQIMHQRINHKIVRAFFVFALIILLYGSFPASAREMENFPVVKLQTLDKVTARTTTFEARVGSTVKFGPLFIKTQSCQKAPPVEQPEAAAFLQVWQVLPDDTPEWIFSGWMFASSPALSYMDHPIYDVWVLDCLEHKTGEEEPSPEEEAPPAAAPAVDSSVPAEATAADDGDLQE